MIKKVSLSRACRTTHGSTVVNRTEPNLPNTKASVWWDPEIPNRICLVTKLLLEIWIFGNFRRFDSNWLKFSDKKMLIADNNSFYWIDIQLFIAIKRNFWNFKKACLHLCWKFFFFNTIFNFAFLAFSKENLIMTFAFRGNQNIQKNGMCRHHPTPLGSALSFEWVQHYLFIEVQNRLTIWSPIRILIEFSILLIKDFT